MHAHAHDYIMHDSFTDFRTYVGSIQWCYLRVLLFCMFPIPHRRICLIHRQLNCSKYQDGTHPWVDRCKFCNNPRCRTLYIYWGISVWDKQTGYTLMWSQVAPVARKEEVCQSRIWHWSLSDSWRSTRTASRVLSTIGYAAKNFRLLRKFPIKQHQRLTAYAGPAIAIYSRA